MLESITSFVELATAIVVLWGAIWGLNKWRKETIGKRKVELAEDVLAYIYEWRDIISDVRNPWSSTEEDNYYYGNKDLDEKESNQYQLPIKRLRRHAEFLAKFRATRYRFISYFGSQGAEVFKKTDELVNRIDIAADILTDYSIMKSKNWESSLMHEQERREHEKTIGWHVRKDDPFKIEVDDAVVTAEEICRPYISESHDNRTILELLLRFPWKIPQIFYKR